MSRIIGNGKIYKLINGNVHHEVRLRDSLTEVEQGIIVGACRGNVKTKVDRLPMVAVRLGLGSADLNRHCKFTVFIKVYALGSFVSFHVPSTYCCTGSCLILMRSITAVIVHVDEAKCCHHLVGVFTPYHSNLLGRTRWYKWKDLHPFSAMPLSRIR